MTEENRPERTEDSDWARFDALLPDFVGERLSDEDRRWMEAFAASSPRAARELEIERRIGEAFDTRVRQIPVDVGLDSLMARIRADARPAAVEAPSPRTGVSALFERIAGLFSGPRLGLAMAVIVLVQGGLLARYMLPQEAPEAVYRSSDSSAPRVYVRVLFANGVSEAELRKTLRDAGARIVWGPDQLGEYWLQSSKHSPEELLARLEREKITATAVLDRVGPPHEAP
ncbi:MAG: hypothetical protein R3E48_06795 [Burkholderiaceae bacterium]